MDVEIARAPEFLGRHVLAEFWGCSNVDNPDTVEMALVTAAKVFRLAPEPTPKWVLHRNAEAFPVMQIQTQGFGR